MHRVSGVRVATYNIRNGRALDLSSFWWTRRAAVARVIERVDADVWAFQEVHAFQRRWLERRVLRADAWGSVGDGRDPGGRGEQVPLFHRLDRFPTAADASTRWFGPTPEVAGSAAPGAVRPRIATAAVLTSAEGRRLRIVNLHLDSDSTDRRADSLRQLGAWLVDRAAADASETATLVLGDFNGVRSDPGYEALVEAGLAAVELPDGGATSNGFGRRLDEQRQIDHVFVSGHLDVRAARIDRQAGHASDHFPVVVDLAWVMAMPTQVAHSE